MTNKINEDFIFYETTKEIKDAEKLHLLEQREYIQVIWDKRNP